VHTHDAGSQDATQLGKTLLVGHKTGTDTILGWVALGHGDFSQLGDAQQVQRRKIVRKPLRFLRNFLSFRSQLCVPIFHFPPARARRGQHIGGGIQGKKLTMPASAFYANQRNRVQMGVAIAMTQI